MRTSSVVRGWLSTISSAAFVWEISPLWMVGFSSVEAGSEVGNTVDFICGANRPDGVTKAEAAGTKATAAAQAAILFRFEV